MSFRNASMAAASLVGTLLAALPAVAAEMVPARAGYNFDAQHVHGGVRWGYADLYTAPVKSAAFNGCSWSSVPTAYGRRFRPVCSPG